MSQFVEMFGNTPMSYEMQDCFSLIRNGANIKQGQFEGGIPITRIETISDEIVDRQKMGYAGIADNKYELYYLQDGDILISHINSLKHIGKCALYNKKENESIIHGMNLLCLRPNIVTINPVFAIHMLRSNIIRKGITDITKPAVNQASFSAKDFGKLRTIIPPMDKQMLFVSIAEQADKSKFGDFKSQFIEMMGDFRSNPKGWKIKKLSELASYTIGLTYKPEQVCDVGTIVLRSGNIQDNQINLDDLVRVNTIIRENLWVREGDILMCSRNGSASLVGKVAQIKAVSEPMTYGAFMTVIRSEYSDFLYLYFQSANFRDQISGGKSSTMNQITQKMLDKIEFPFPDLDTISSLSSILQQADKSKSIIQNAMTYLNDIHSDTLRRIA